MYRGGEISNTNHQVDWYDNPPSPAQYVAMWQMVYKYLVGTAGLTNMLWGWDVGGGSTGLSAWYPGDAYVDVVAIDNLSPPYPNASATYTELLTYNKPIFFASIGLSYNIPAAFSGNNYTTIVQPIIAHFPAVFGYSMWAQNLGLNEQNGAVQCLTGGPMLNRSNLPRFSRAR